MKRLSGLIFWVAIWVFVTSMLNYRLEAKRQHFLIEQCLSGNTLSVTFADGSTTMCVEVQVELNNSNSFLNDA